jgi:hypothetical protein
VDERGETCKGGGARVERRIERPHSNRPFDVDSSLANISIEGMPGSLLLFDERDDRSRRETPY